MSKSIFKTDQKLFERLCDIFPQETFEKIGGQNSKLRTYAVFKKVQGYEEYLTENVLVRKNVTKFRLYNHKLMIEVGRHQKLQANERYCPGKGQRQVSLFIPLSNLQISTNDIPGTHHRKNT